MISKIGEINPKKYLGNVLGLYNKDALTNLFKTYKDSYDSLEKHESKAVSIFLNKYAAQLINDYFNK